MKSQRTYHSHWMYGVLPKGVCKGVIQGRGANSSVYFDSRAYITASHNQSHEGRIALDLQVVEGRFKAKYNVVSIYIHTHTHIYISNGLSTLPQRLRGWLLLLLKKSKLKSFIRPWFHGCNYYTNRQAVCKSQKKNLSNDSDSRRITLKTIKTHHKQPKDMLQC